ncbi:hypothetical protein [Nocardia huaxiensis]|uniref:Mce-associated membrane protein n=1 Tax=Nocardia huaxiensis TaxID=2755382 RepID=A0A7D6VDZ7_9NOCA|nr:hypothetical protein [Nocardia huaxiensis]QLY30617.1 hypothetical protein H0264_36850 [Nocardia huaxiensis]UFS95777.1 hypothetical protein LPY97_34825 [Nocardia huaxiensis]
MSEDTDPKRAAAEATSADSVSETKTETAAPEREAVELAKPAAEPAKPAAGVTVSLKLSTLAVAAAIVLLIAGLITTTTLWLNARGDLSDQQAQAADDRHAEQVATDYAMGAATLNYADFNSWTQRLKANTTDSLAKKFDASSSKLQEILVPLKWTSSPSPLGAQVIGRDGGAYKVNVYLNVTSTNAQNPDGVLTTIYYTVTVDPEDWKVTEVSGIDMPMPKNN